jgi:hypothetical protein
MSVTYKSTIRISRLVGSPYWPPCVRSNTAMDPHREQCTYNIACNRDHLGKFADTIPQKLAVGFPRTARSGRPSDTTDLSYITMIPH